MKIRWLGHASFLITLSDGKTIITDPYDETVGYPLPQKTAGIVTVSHQHFDHNAVDNIPGDPSVVEGNGEHNVDGIIFTGIPSYHDPSQGSQRGDNTIFIIEADGLKLCHLGDLGHDLEDGQLEQLKGINVLMVPVGGHFTIDASQAKKIVDQIKPEYVLPMHYKTGHISLPIETPDKFLNNYPGHRVEDELNIDPKNMPASTEVVQLKLNQN